MTPDEVLKWCEEGLAIADWKSWQERTRFQHEAEIRLPAALRALMEMAREFLRLDNRVAELEALIRDADDYDMHASNCRWIKLDLSDCTCWQGRARKLVPPLAAKAMEHKA